MAEERPAVNDVLLKPLQDRRLLPHVPDPSGIRRASDRRNNINRDKSKPQYATFAGQRFDAEFDVLLTAPGHKRFHARCADISQTGMQLKLPKAVPDNLYRVGDPCSLDFSLLPGIMQEGTESRYRIRATVVRWSPDTHTFAVKFA